MGLVFTLNNFQRVAHCGRIGVCGANAAPHVVTLVEDHEPGDAATELQEMRDVLVIQWKEKGATTR